MSNVEQAIQTGNEIHITVNGAVKRVADGLTVVELLGTLGLEQGRVAVELNRAIVKRARWTEVLVKTGDQLEIVQFVGGG